VHSHCYTLFGAVSLLIWVYLLVARGGFWRMRRMVVAAMPQPAVSARVAVIVPARNEAESIGKSIDSLLSQSIGANLHVFLVDDGSTDHTAEVAQETARKAGVPERLTVIQGRPLLPGWTGKMWAVQQGIEQALKSKPDFLLLTDADIVHAPDQVATLIDIAERGRFDLASLMVRLRCSSFAEKLLIPAFVFFFFKLYPPAWIANSRKRTAGAAGGCILVRPDALSRAGGIDAIRHEIIDDCALARAVKSSEGRVFLGLGASAESIRPYGSFAEIGNMISRTAFNQLHHSTLLLMGSLIGLTLTYLAAPLLLLNGHMVPAALGGLAWLLMMIAYLPIVRFYRLNSLWALALPFVALFYMGATLYSAVRFWSGSGGQWKGRAQDRLRNV
jgi:hopene-associated glycosyltransferase HpnB